MERKVLILPITILCFIATSCSQRAEKKDYTLEIGKGKVLKVDNQTFWVFPTTLTNMTKDTLKYFSKSCSWQDFHSVDNKKLEIEQALCDQNIPIVLTLPPNQSKTNELRLLINQTMDGTVVNFKIGFHLVHDQVFMDNYDFQSQFNKNIIWSNQISM
jgi:hypothetical protein